MTQGVSLHTTYQPLYKGEMGNKIIISVASRESQVIYILSLDIRYALYYHNDDCSLT